MKLTLGFSPCPNDTFIFDALVHQSIDTEGLEFNVQLEDVQTLNQWALQGKLDISKISYGVLPLLLQQYHLLSSGGALGKGVGPLLISAAPVDTGIAAADWTHDRTIAIPGEHTTAHFLFSQAFPHTANKVFMRFDEIENWVLQGTPHENRAGVIIHENRFTYQQRGLHKVVDLGDYWEQSTGCPIPLGGIVVRSQFDFELKQKINRVVRRSLEYAFAHYPRLTAYVQQHAQEMSEEVMRQHIDLYVNQYSLDLGADGKAAILKLMEVYEHTHHPSNSANPVVIA